MSSIWNTIKKDVERFHAPDDISLAHGCPQLPTIVVLRLLLSYMRSNFNGFRSLLHYRLAISNANAGLKILRRILLLLFPVRDNFYIGVGRIEPGGVFFHHPFSTIINAEYIGYGCTFRNNTTIGNKVKNGVSARPSFGNNVHVGPNVVIIGDVKIGDNVVVGAGAVITKNVPANSIVVGNPAFLIERDGVRIKEPL